MSVLKAFGTVFVTSMYVVVSLVPTNAQEVSSGFPVSSEIWQMLVTYSGYADLALDARPGFEGREYLSGEWATAISYGDHGPMWLTRKFLYPDWDTNSDFEMVEDVGFADPMNPTNADGLLHVRSVIANSHFEVTIDYTMMKTTDGIPLGRMSAGGGGAGDSLQSNPFVYKQTYSFHNKSDEPIENFSLFQLLHGLTAGSSLYDDRAYGGPMSEFRYQISQRGTSYGFNNNTGGVYMHDDTIAFLSREMPVAYDNGPYGDPSAGDSHEIGKPGTGIHVNIENDDLKNRDSYEEEKFPWVGGALKYDLGTLGPGATREIEFLIALRTESIMVAPQLNLEMGEPLLEDGLYKIRFNEPEGLTDSLGLGYILFATPVLEGLDSEMWKPESLPLMIMPQGQFRFGFDVPVKEGEPERYYQLRAVFSF